MRILSTPQFNPFSVIDSRSLLKSIKRGRIHFAKPDLVLTTRQLSDVLSLVVMVIEHDVRIAQIHYAVIEAIAVNMV
jgi:hypothetical protein